MARETRKKIVSKKHLARLERERRQSRYILIASLAVIVLVLGLVGYSILDQRVLMPLKPVAVVDGERISLADFQTRVRYIRQITVNQAVQSYQIMQMFGEDPQFQQFYLSSLQQADQQLQPAMMGQQVLDALIDETLIRQEARRRGITASAEEIDKLLQTSYGFYADGSPTPSATFEPRATSTLNATQQALITPTSTATATPTPTTTLTATLTVTPTLAVTLTSTATATLAVTPVITETPGPTPTLEPSLTPTPYTLEEFQKNYQEELKMLDEAIQFKEADYRGLAELQILSEKLRDVILAGLTAEQDLLWARHIQFADEQLAKDALNRLAQGEDFGALATELSQDFNSQPRAGDLSWLTRFDLVNRFGEDFAKAAYDLKIGEISQPVQSEAGYHLIQVLGREVRTLSPDELNRLRQQEFQNWIAKQRETYKIETFDRWMDSVPTEPSLPPEIQQLLLAASQPAP